MSRKRKTACRPEVPHPDISQIEGRLIILGKIIVDQNPSRLRHPQQEESGEWTGADVRVTSDFQWEPQDFINAHDLLVRTRHAKVLTWLFLEVRDAFSLWLDASNKYGFYGSLAEAALEHLARNQPESEDARPLLLAVLERAFESMDLLRSQGRLPEDGSIVIHTRDAEGRQQRIDPLTGDITS